MYTAFSSYPVQEDNRQTHSIVVHKKMKMQKKRYPPNTERVSKTCPYNTSSHLNPSLTTKRTNDAKNKLNSDQPFPLFKAAMSQTLVTVPVLVCPSATTYDVAVGTAVAGTDPPRA